MPLLFAEGISKTFRERSRVTHALRNVSLHVASGEILGIAGESGSGKSTLARVITGMIPAEAGVVTFDGKIYDPAGRKPPKWLIENMQMIFQDPTGSFHPKKTIGKTIMDAARNFRIGENAAEREEMIRRYMEKCGLDPVFFDRYPQEVSGGQCQRAGIVRAIIVKPRILILDEATSALDVLVQKSIIKLLLEVRGETGMSMVVISHDLALLGGIAERIMVMKDGEVVEEAETSRLLRDPREKYTQELLESVL